MYASRGVRAVAQARQLISKRTFTATARQLSQTQTPTPAAPTATAEAEVAETGRPASAVMQAPNRAEVWSRSQRPRSEAMAGPRFEQTDFDAQPRPWAAIELIHKQPVRWTHDRIVACDGGGGPHGHPKIYINTDKPEIATCNYCGLPFANEHHRKYLESLPQTSYPLN
uniref:NADH-ubiquinone oxidoreductase-like protein n=1 Tax=Chaetomium thermophilum (strain DSM 1495 / CBS 144.50 / IMI 039719) TaxID=759272 RepID=UPI0022656F6E|nr:Chain M, NADH-ubiquinone oxidoreductase-like protein [Thermochaetoides thermophila DSM 1495]7ZMB_M Chain M, NADH-ubiquinone oxidoreductase-like protein [Thermochaetoides thermophila DSM 1495]7ZMG_M Chain M, NADH-ubiquinone oxidoreductase-like protein [Thermochaetoides thermophila DSM 1495]